MAYAGTPTLLAHFEARIQNSKNRLIAIPAQVQRELGLEHQANNHLVQVSIRRLGRGRWNHHYFKLTSDNEFAIPADVSYFKSGVRVEVKIHRLIADAAVSTPSPARSAADLLVKLSARPRPGWRSDGALRLDEYLYGDMHETERIR